MADEATELPEFKKWEKIPRLKNTNVEITEKIDGTNAHIVVPEDPASPVIAASRNRYLVQGQPDNFAFRAWVEVNAESLRRLGPGRHYGEWFGPGIGRGYGLTERRWFLFETWRTELPEGLPGNVGIVPVLVTRSLDKLDEALSLAESQLRNGGSVAVPGFNRPEGFVVRLNGGLYKNVFDKAGPSPEEAA
jgi:hypothetical protein